MKPTQYPITRNEVNQNYICVAGTTFDNLDGSYTFNGTYNNRTVYKKNMN